MQGKPVVTKYLDLSSEFKRALRLIDLVERSDKFRDMDHYLQNMNDGTQKVLLSCFRDYMDHFLTKGLDMQEL